MLTSGPPTSPNKAKRGGTKPDRYILVAVIFAVVVAVNIVVVRMLE